MTFNEDYRYSLILLRFNSRGCRNSTAFLCYQTKGSKWLARHGFDPIGSYKALRQQSVVRVVLVRVADGSSLETNGGVFCADSLVDRTLVLALRALHYIAAQNIHVIGLGNLVPQVFEPNGRIRVPVLR
jgi:hypothetical protein